MTLAVAAVSLGAFGITACGGGSAPPADPARSTGQSGLMGKTYAGQNACNAKTHERPFIIEWDATDMSMFESRAATDVVFVQYEGCNLKVLDGCANDSIRGAYGAYRPVEWTSGSTEKMDISSENELYAKLPLGAATLGGRVATGEKFRMEYFVSGVRTSTRSAVYRGELSKLPGCTGATHFVYGFALGAFALASEKKVAGEASVGFAGMGGGAKHANSTNADKKGGVIESCRGETAKEVKTCQVPVRLMLRNLNDGDAPAGSGASGATADGAGAGGGAAGGAVAPPSRSDRNELNMEEVKLRESAARKRIAKDGKGCLADLDEADKRWPNSARNSTRPDGMMNIRGECLMLTGDCENGRKQLRMAMERMGMNTQAVDTVVKVRSDELCPKKK
jgi:hypothetical protein